MNFTKLPTDILIRRYSDKDIISIVKFQTLWGLIEEQPSKEIALRYMTNKQYDTALSYLDDIRVALESTISSLNKKRSNDKIKYLKNKEKKEIPLAERTLNDNGTTAERSVDKIRLDKIRLDKIRLDKTRLEDTPHAGEELLNYGEFGLVHLTRGRYENYIQKFGQEQLDYAIEKLDSWLAKPEQKKKQKGDHFGYFKTGSWVFEGYRAKAPLEVGEYISRVPPQEYAPKNVSEWDGYWYDFKHNKRVCEFDNDHWPDWSKYNEETGEFEQ